MHNLVDWKAQGRVRYIGVTHYSVDAYEELEKVLRSETLDFVQLNYSIALREAEQRILPLARERGTGKPDHMRLNVEAGVGIDLNKVQLRELLENVST